MKKRHALPLLCLAVMLLAPSAQAADPIPGQYIVVLEDGADADAVAADHRRLAKAEVLDTYGHALSGYVAKLSTAGLARVEADPRVASVTQDVRTKPFQGKPGGGTTTPPAQTLPTGINRVDAELSEAVPLATTTEPAPDPTPNVAVFDTGVQTNHPDLNVAGGVNCLGARYTANDGTIGDQYGHGTHVAGIVGARDDSYGVVGTAPGARIWSVRIGDGAGSSTASAQLCGIDWLTANAASLGIKVVNASLGLYSNKGDDDNCGYTNGDVLHQAVCRSRDAGLLWVFAAGNTVGDVNQMPGAGWNEVLAVTAMGDSNGRPLPSSTSSASCKLLSGKSQSSYVDDKFASFSRYAVSDTDRAHTVAAPGICINSTYKGSAYGNNTGTSMAAPHATGIAARCYATGQCTGTPAETIQKLIADAEAYNQANSTFGFTGDPLRPVSSAAHYGYLLRAGLY